jgi:hypothetical protein
MGSTMSALNSQMIEPCRRRVVAPITVIMSGRGVVRPRCVAAWCRVPLCTAKHKSHRSRAAALRRRVGTRECPECRAQCQQPLAQLDHTEDRMLCPVYRHIAVL